MRLVDTNILLYSVSKSPGENSKREVAQQILVSSGIAVSVQVLQEFYWQVTRPNARYPLSEVERLLIVESLCDGPVQNISIEVFLAAIATAARYRISYWDAAIIEAARALGCHTVLSEDLQHGQNFNGVRVENPFL